MCTLDFVNESRKVEKTQSQTTADFNSSSDIHWFLILPNNDWGCCFFFSQDKSYVISPQITNIFPILYHRGPVIAVGFIIVAVKLRHLETTEMLK